MPFGFGTSSGSHSTLFHSIWDVLDQHNAGPAIQHNHAPIRRDVLWHQPLGADPTSRPKLQRPTSPPSRARGGTARRKNNSPYGIRSHMHGLSVQGRLADNRSKNFATPDQLAGRNQQPTPQQLATVKRLHQTATVYHPGLNMHLLKLDQNLNPVELPMRYRPSRFAKSHPELEQKPRRARGGRETGRERMLRWAEESKKNAQKAAALLEGKRSKDTSALEEDRGRRSGQGGRSSSFGEEEAEEGGGVLAVLKETAEQKKKRIDKEIEDARKAECAAFGQEVAAVGPAKKKNLAAIWSW